MAAEIKINYRGNEVLIGGDEVFVIAEIGKNFMQTEEDRPISEYLDNAKKLIDAAIYAGADAVKFQTHEVEDEQLNIPIVSPHFKGSDRYSWVKRNTEATPMEFWKEIKEYCENKNIIFFSTPMSRKAAIKLNTLGVPIWKVGSGDVEDNVMLSYLRETDKPIIISNGMVSLEELDDVIKYLGPKNSQIVLLYCVSLYPCPPEQFNLATIELLKEKYPDVVIGFSDHSIGSEAVLPAIKLGAKIIEKHFSIRRDLWGSDHKVSMTPDEMKDMVEKIRRKEYQKVDVSAFYGSKTKELEGANNMFRPYFNKGLMAGRDINEGEKILPDMIYAMRPIKYAGGLPAKEYDKVVGMVAGRNIKKFEPITWEKLK